MRLLKTLLTFLVLVEKPPPHTYQMWFSDAGVLPASVHPDDLPPKIPKRAPQGPTEAPWDSHAPRFIPPGLRRNRDGEDGTVCLVLVEGVCL